MVRAAVELWFFTALGFAAAGAFAARRPSARTEDRTVAAVAIAASVVAAMAAGRPVGIPALDLVFRAGLVVALVLGVARCARWLVPVLCVAGLGLAVAAGGQRPLAGAAMGIAVVAVVVPAGSRATSAAAGGLLGVSLLSLPTTGHPLAFGLATGGVFGVGLFPWLVTSDRYRPRAARRAVLGAAAFVTVAVAGFGVSALQARPDLDAGTRAAKQAADALRAGDTVGAATALSISGRRFDTAHERLTSWTALPARMVPGLAQQASAAARLSALAAEVAGAAGDAAGRADPSAFRLIDGRIDPAPIIAIRPTLHRAAAVITDGRRRIPELRSPWLVPPLADGIDVFARRLGEADRSATTASAAADVLPGLLGAGTPRRFFVAFVNPGEARGSGGIVGVFAELVADKGRLSLPTVGSDAQLIDGQDLSRRSLDGPPGFAFRYGRFNVPRTWQNVSISPHFPWTGDVIRQIYRQAGGSSVDGVVLVDPVGLGALVDITGPISVPEIDQPLDGPAVVDLLLRRQYTLFGDDQGRRKLFLLDLTRTMFARLTSGALPPSTELVRRLGPTVADHHVMLWSRRTPEQRLFGRVGADGALPRDGGDVLGVIDNSASAAKLDQFLERRIDYRVSLEGEGRVEGVVTARLTNNVPADTLPSYVVGRGDGGVPPRVNRLYVSVYSRLGLRRATVDGATVVPETQREAGLAVYSTFVDIPPGETRTIVLTLAGPVTGARYRLRFFKRPTVLPDRTTVEVSSTRQRGTRRVTTKADGDLVVRTGLSLR
ncbi:MAG TPA: DUF4012 domain-containing protein [Acidimicrobiales bacterium]|nr:DUF4012 domain-containing protein [Acidimicrobiales bacterium]